MALNCERHDCIHNNNEGNCFAKIIAVKGRTAKTTAQTICDSYVPAKDWLGFEFANDFMEADILPSNTQNIKCGAGNCRYNFDTVCTATGVLINDSEANCETFDL